jgi:HlyD family secretion protein
MPADRSGASALARRIAFWSLPAAALAVALAYAFLPQPTPADVVEVVRAPMRVTLDERGVTRVHDVYTVAAPLAGRLVRTPLHVGDAVEAGVTVVARIEPGDPALLDPRSRRQAEAQVRSATAELRYAQAGIERARADRDFAAGELRRLRALRERGGASEHDVDNAERAARTAAASLDAAHAALVVRQHELARAQAALIVPGGGGADASGCGCVEIRAPISGEVLAIHQRSETVVPPGLPLVDVGDRASIEIVADYLTTEAVTIREGQRAIVDGWGGAAFDAVVSRVEGAAFTKVSALGIEEQRVNVVLDPASPPEQWRGLGHGYEVQVHVVAWEAPDVVVVPLTALFRRGEQRQVFAVDGAAAADGAAAGSTGTARLRDVTIGQRAGLDVRVVAGVVAGERVVDNPGDRIRDGVRITRR